MQHRMWVAVLCVALVACSRPAPPPASAPPPATIPRGEISAAELERDLRALAADSMRGRETGTEDARRAAAFLADRVQRLGLEPAGDSMYLQRIPLQRESFASTSVIAVDEAGGSQALVIGQDVVPLVNLGPGVPPTKLSAAGDLVFVAYGVTVPGKRDDYAGVPMAGRVVVVVVAAPPGADSATRARLEGEAGMAERLARILPGHPAAVVLLLPDSGTAGYHTLSRALARTVAARSNASSVPDGERVLPLIMLAPLRAGSPLLPARWPADDRAEPVSGRRLRASVRQVIAPFTGYNVVAVVRGSQATLARTFVALGAHYDHIGIVPPVDGDSIANGADDDGSGSVALLAVARALQQSEVKPQRSTLFVWHVGEEQGLLGSSYFVEHPTVPVDSIVAQVNADMIGRNASGLLYVVGPVAAPNGMSRRLGAIVDSVNASQRMPFAIDRSWDSPSHPEHIYERSDHYSYARKGIPIVFLTTGLHADYHMPSDEADRIDYAKLARVSRLLRDVVLSVGNSDRRPR